jgi:methionyl-tRNA formyltransferase
MKVVFFGSSSFSLPVLWALAESERHQLVGVATQPDRPSGRNRKIQPGIVHAAARERNLPLIMPEKIGSPEGLESLRQWQPDIIAVASYGQYIPTSVLNLPPKGAVNVHPSLLPKYRGAAPLQWSIANGETESGVTIFQVVKAMDAGAIWLQEHASVHPDESAVDLSERFAALGAKLLLSALDVIEEGAVSPMPQDGAAATHARKISKEDGLLDWQKPAVHLHNRIRGFQPWPGCFFRREGVIIKVWKSRAVEGQGTPGEVLSTSSEGPVVMTGEGALQLIELQPEGKKRMSGQAFLCGCGWSVGERLDVARTGN